MTALKPLCRLCGKTDDTKDPEAPTESLQGLCIACRREQGRLMFGPCDPHIEQLSFPITNKPG